MSSPLPVSIPSLIPLFAYVCCLHTFPPLPFYICLLCSPTSPIFSLYSPPPYTYLPPPVYIHLLIPFHLFTYVFSLPPPICIRLLDFPPPILMCSLWSPFSYMHTFACPLPNPQFFHFHMFVMFVPPQICICLLVPYPYLYKFTASPFPHFHAFARYSLQLFPSLCLCFNTFALSFPNLYMFGFPLLTLPLFIYIHWPPLSPLSPHSYPPPICIHSLTSCHLLPYWHMFSCLLLVSLLISA